MKSFARFLLFLLFVLVVLAGFLFTIRNSTPVSLWLGVDFAPRPVSIWLLGGFILGTGVGLFLGFGLWGRLRTGLTLRQQRQQLERQEHELAQLRASLAQRDALESKH
ncbi:MAG TPA: lipopolysaccharide assembly protein LapA domain-containing protein [Hyphomicrobiales bacterium]|nr:lipopolysaccharide assembly protein LapA domain-containing protein [Hyphomicrobiales bacterium]